MRTIVACTVAIVVVAATARAEPRSDRTKAAKAEQKTPGGDTNDSDGEQPSAAPVTSVTQGTIVQRAGDIAYIDLGDDDGLWPGSVLHVLRTISIIHPVTKQAIVDYFPVGTMTLAQVSRTLSFGRLEKRIAETVKVGDIVRVITPPRVRKTAAGEVGRPGPGALPAKPGPTKAEPQVVPSKPASGKESAAAVPSKPASGKESEGDQAIAEFARIFQKTLGLPLAERIEVLYEYRARLEAAHADSPFLAALTEEIANLRRIVSEHARALKATQAIEDAEAQRVRSATEAQAEKVRNLRRLELLASIPEVLEAADVIELAITMRDPSAVQAAFAYVRAPEATSYDRVKLTPDGDGYFRGRLPASLVRPPTIELFLEVIGYDGQSVTAGTALEPRVLKVEAARAPSPKAPLRASEIRGFFEYIDFYQFKGNDYYLGAQGDFTLRAGKWLAGVSGGFGVLYGRGGKNDVLQQLQDPSMCGSVDPMATNSPCGRQVGFNYGYFEVEFHFGKWIGMAPRLIAGQTISGPGAGGELKLRIGQATGTNLQLGVSYFSNFGATGSFHLEWHNIKGWPMGAAVVVTNQPAEGDVGVRIYYQLAYRSRPWLQPALRVGAAARNLEQIGLNLGLGLIMAW